MALPASVTASGAGTTAFNITYTLSAGVDVFGNHFYRDATSGKGGIYFTGANEWELYDTVSTSGVTGGSPRYTNPGSGAATFPLTGWAVATGTSPAPAFTTGGGGGGGGTTRRHTAQWI